METLNSPMFYMSNLKTPLQNLTEEQQQQQQQQQQYLLETHLRTDKSLKGKNMTIFSKRFDKDRSFVVSNLRHKYN
jgi:hypothetical protein